MIFCCLAQILLEHVMHACLRRTSVMHTKILWTRAIINAIGIYKFIKLEIHAPLQTQQNIILLDISKIWLRKYIQQILFLRSSYEHISPDYFAVSYSYTFVKIYQLIKEYFFFKIWSKSNLQNMLAGSNNICLLLRFVLYFLLKPNFAYNFT